MSTLHLASQSPRRREILASMGLEFTAAGVDIDETRRPAEGPKDMVRRLAIEKAEASPNASGRLILGADTVVVLGDDVFGKPDGKDDALRSLAQLSGRMHQVMTGVALRSDSTTLSNVSVTNVEFREIEQDEALQYWQSGEPVDKAGSYAIQGLGGAFVRSIQGSYSGVVGLPVFETAALLRTAGIDIVNVNKSGQRA